MYTDKSHPSLSNGEELQNELRKANQGKSAADIKDNLNHSSLKNNKRLIGSQEECRKKARQFVSSETTTPLTLSQQTSENIRFMDFCVQNIVDKYHLDAKILSLAEEYKASALTQTERAKALVKFEKESQLYLESIAPLNAGIELGYATSNFCQQIAGLTKNKDLIKLATGIGAMTQVVDGINKISQASAMISHLSTTSSAVAATSATASSATAISSGTMMLGAVSAVIAAGITIYSLLSDDGEAQDNGLDHALNAIHSAIMEMWLDTRRNFSIVFEKLDELDRKITNMERQNWKRFLASMKAIHYYGEMTREQLRQLKTTSHESLNFVHHGLESYMRVMTRADSRSVVSYIGKVGSATTIERLTKHSNKLEAWLTQGAAISDYSGHIPTINGNLNVTTPTLTSLLKNAMADEVSNDGSYPLGLYASLARSIDRTILANENLTVIVNPQDWNRVLASYIEVIQSGIPLIIKDTSTTQQAFFIDEVKRIKQVPSLILNLLSDITLSNKLWEGLVNEYSAAVKALQVNIKQILEERRQQFNEEYDLPTEQDILRLHESISENITRIQGAPLPESLKIDDPMAWLQTLEAKYDSQYERSQMVWGEIYEHRHSWLGGDRTTGNLGSISAKQAEILFNKDNHFSQIIQDPYFLIAKKYKCVDVDLSCFHQNFQPSHPEQWDGHNATYFTFSLRSKELKETFIQMNLYVNPNINPGGGGLHGFDRVAGVNYAQWCGGGPRQMEVSQKRAISNATKKKIQERLENEVLCKHRKSAAQIIATRIDFTDFECAALKLFSFVKLLVPKFEAKPETAKQEIQTLINDAIASGAIKPLQKLLNPKLDVLLLSDDLQCPIPQLDSFCTSKLGRFLKRKVNSKPLAEHRLWQNMAHALASLEMLEQKLLEESKRKVSIDCQQIDTALSDGILKLVEHDQAFSDGLYQMQSIINAARPLIFTQLLKESDLNPIKDQIIQLDTQFRVRVNETKDEFSVRDYETPEISSIPIEPEPSVILSAEKKAELSQQWIEGAQSCVTFSFQDTIKLIEKVLTEVSSRRLTNADAPAMLFVGRTQVGKSTLTNSLSGVTFEFMQDELGRRRVKKSEQSVADEFTQVGTGLGSETIFPKIKLELNPPRYLIDMPGYLDTRGEPQQISTAIAFQCLKNHCKTLKAIVMVCDENELLSDGLVSLRTTLKHVGHMLPLFTATEKNHVVLAITKPRGEITQENVMLLLKRLLITEYAMVTESDKLAIKQALLYLTEASGRIVFVDVTNPSSVAALNATLNDLPIRPMSELNLAPSSTEMSLMKQVLQTVINTKREIKESIHRLECILAMQLKKKLVSIHLGMSPELIAHYDQLKASLSGLDASELDQFLEFTVFIEQQKDLIRQALIMTGSLSQILTTKNVSFSTSNPDSTSNELIEKYTEYKENRDFFNRMLRIAPLFSCVMSETRSNNPGVSTTSKQRADKKHSTMPKTTPPINPSGDSLDGYLTDEELYTQLESETQDIILENSICVRTDEKYWKKTGIRGQRVLKEDECFSTMHLSKERHAFFKEMHKKPKWTNMIITDTEISIMVPLKLGTK